MKLTKCANGHYYDAEKYSSCPHCAGGNGGPGGMDDMTTESFANPGAAPVMENRNGAGFGEEDVTMSGPLFGPGRNTETITDTASTSNEPDSRGRSYQEQDEDGKTVSYLNWIAQEENRRKTEGTDVTLTWDERRRETVRPVVGWLVCVSGSNYGKSFCLYSGRNFIGRDGSNDVCLAGDRGISRVKQAVIIYEPIQRQFFAQSGENSHELCYLNKQPLLSNTLLHDRDELTLGQTTLVFVPFCDERNGWGVPGAK